MTQKSRKSEYFKKEGERLYRRYLKQAEKIVGNSTTYSTQLDRVCRKLFGRKFLGIYTSDRIPERIRRGDMLIANLDSSYEPGSHWVAICKEKNSDLIWLYDSFGREIHKILPEIEGKGRIVESTERDKEQHKSETNCGARCIAFLMVFNLKGSDYAKYI